MHKILASNGQNQIDILYTYAEEVIMLKGQTGNWTMVLLIPPSPVFATGA